MSAACNSGDPILLPQWFAVGKKVTGDIRVAATGLTFVRGANDLPSGSAVVDHWSGRVLACGGETVRRWSRPVDVVGYLTQPFDLESNPWGFEFRTAISHLPASAPANDLMANARPVTTLPFTTTLDTTLADADGPALIDYDHCRLSTIERNQAATVWYSYTPTRTGPAPEVSASPTTAWTVANGYGGQLASGIFQVRPDGVAVRVTNADPWDCDTPVRLVKGRKYLIGVGTAWDGYASAMLVPGGPISVSVR